MIPVTPYSFLVLITFVWTVHSREYYIKDRAIPSYLHWKQQNSPGKNLFPNDIIVNVSMSRVQGTFVYSFDRNMNQLIVTMRDGLPHVMDIELNTQRISVFLPSICGCDRCRYEALELRIQIGDNIKIQCNGGDVKMFKNENTKKINEKYPVFNTKQKRSLYSNDSDHLWLVNTPQYENTYPSNDQLYGCIFRAEYEENVITFTEVTPNIDYKCLKTCTDNICNGGQCYETYGDKPICNCTSTFKNGQYCNETIRRLNIRTTEINLQTDSYKLSWNSSVHEIFELGNSHTQIRLGVQVPTLFLEYTTSQRRRIISKVELSNNYVPNKEYICIIRFKNKHIDIQLFNNGSWTNEIMWTNQDLSREIFNSLLLQSGKGIIDMVYKDNEEYNWRKFIIKTYNDTNAVTISSPKSVPTTTSTTETTTKESTTKATTTQSKTIILILSIGMVLIIAVAAIAIIFVYRRRLKPGTKQISDGTNSNQSMVNKDDTVSSDEEKELNLMDVSATTSYDNNHQTQSLT